MKGNRRVLVPAGISFEFGILLERGVRLSSCIMTATLSMQLRNLTF